ncbi:MAG: septal ring lytic transglycosylase RlpA family protein [Alphaproteobacteria bacterium]|nr:septal ring lytic transglycosylase RlpA family protein [Alphaproteobacteria bacterium]
MVGNLFPARKVWGVLGLLLALGACSEARLAIHATKTMTDPQALPGVYKVGNPYQINGIWYYPAEDYAYDETGIASWYGPGFHAKSTANGETFDQNDVTAAHRTLPLPSLVRVTNLDNGRVLTVRINDRGPYAQGRILDLSRRSGQLLGMETKGTAHVRVQILAEESRQLAAAYASQSANKGGEGTKVAAAPRESVTAQNLDSTPAPASKVLPTPPSRPKQVTSEDLADLKSQPVQQTSPRATSMFIQAGSFARYDNALRLSTRLSSLGQSSITQVNIGSQPMFRVRIGPIANLDEADRVLDQAVRSGAPDAKLIVD